MSFGRGKIASGEQFDEVENSGAMTKTEMWDWLLVLAATHINRSIRKTRMAKLMPKPRITKALDMSQKDKGFT